MCQKYTDPDRKNQSTSEQHSVNIPKATINIRGELFEIVNSLEADLEKSRKQQCIARKILILLFAAGVVTGTAVGVYILVQYLMKPLIYQGSISLQDAEVTSRCNDTDNNEVATVPRRKVSFRINTENFLLEVQVEYKQEWLLTCHEGWNSSWATLVCKHLGYIRLMQHKAVNLTNYRLNHTQGFAQIPLAQTTSTKHIWQTRRECLSGHVVALKCSECGSRSKSSRIIGGTDVTLGRWPWQISLYLNNKHVCGGSIVAPKWIITAAHCVHNYRSPQVSSWSVLAGIISHSSVGQKGSVSAVEKIIYHQKYDDRSHDYDIALMKLDKPLNYSDSIRPVCLPQYDQDLAAGSECWVSGWGYTHPDNTHMPRILKEAMLPLISTKKCNSSCIYNGDITPRMLCAGYLDGKVDACQGDSGGPLVCQTDYTWRLIGVVSWGMGCAEPNRPGVYTKIASFLDWIHKIIEDD
ncbi:transmembrane protease serine 5 [Rana temporaria]|uniref:transmembrane protease serine 5 n=1 Tax=Rana temporaria TaxID=8407 RepID=UPI001AAE06EB|nr:transmembrane protease serine 5 [Rana temporaria]